MNDAILVDRCDRRRVTGPRDDGPDFVALGVSEVGEELVFEPYGKRGVVKRVPPGEGEARGRWWRIARSEGGGRRAIPTNRVMALQRPADWCGTAFVHVDVGRRHAG